MWQWLVTPCPMVRVTSAPHDTRRTGCMETSAEPGTTLYGVRMGMFHPAAWLIGLEGYALLLASAFGDDRAVIDEHLGNVRSVMAHLDRGAMDWVLTKTEVDVRVGYSSWAASYDTEENPLIAAEEPALLAALGGLPPGRAVDVACGTGRVTRLLAELGHDVVGVDATGAMLQRASPLPVAAGAIGALPVRDSAADLITCCLALVHVADLGGTFRELARIVRPGGVVVISDIHVALLPLGGVAMVIIDGEQRALPAHARWPAAYVAAASAAGLSLISLAEPGCVDDGVGGGGELAQKHSAAAADMAYGYVPAAVVLGFRRTR